MMERERKECEIKMEKILDELSCLKEKIESSVNFDVVQGYVQKKEKEEGRVLQVVGRKGKDPINLQYILIMSGVGKASGGGTNQNSNEQASLANVNILELTETIVVKNDNDIIFDVKLYSKGATTNSDSGVTDISELGKILSTIIDCNISLLIHNGVTDIIKMKSKLKVV